MKHKFKKSKKFWTKFFLIFLALTLVDWAVPDPLILIDEITLSIITIFGLWKVVSQ
jgi:hypothetical protein